MSHLTLSQRYEISILNEQKIPKPAIANSIGVNRSTVYRELKRNSDGRNGQYKADLAQKKCELRHEQKNKGKAFTNEIQAFVELYLKQDYSPEQIVGYAKRIAEPCVSCERIYQFIWKDKKDGGLLYRHLRTKGKKYKKRGNLTAGRGQIEGRIAIGQRPKIVECKERFGDLEIDLVIGANHKGALLTINDRATGMLKMRYIESKEAKVIENNTIEILDEWMPFIHTITSDNGKEFTNHREIAEGLNIDYFFAKPYHSWERGANENLNGLVRQYFPKKTNFDLIQQSEVKKAEEILNNRPRKRYNYQTPNEVFVNAINNNGIVAFMT
jgi:transposase, IS30 family